MAIDEIDGDELLQQNSSSSPPAHTHSTGVTTPDQSPGDMNDIWASDLEPENTNTNTTNLNDNSTKNPRPEPILSDLPTLRRQHVTDGYREGLAVGKAQVMQTGFDAGYPIGMAIALRAGTIIGVLEGYNASKEIMSIITTTTTTNPDSSLEEQPSLFVRRLLDQAKDELACNNLLAKLSDEVVADASTIPEVIEDVLVKWEALVLGKVGGVDTALRG